MSRQVEILDKIKTLLSTLTWQKHCDWKKVKITATDFGDHEIPAVQFYPSGVSITHQQSRIYVDQIIDVEVVLKQTAYNEADMETLLEYVEELEQKIGENANLGLSYVHQVEYLNLDVDLHTIEPYYYARLTFGVKHYRPYTGCP